MGAEILDFKLFDYIENANRLKVDVTNLPDETLISENVAFLIRCAWPHLTLWMRPVVTLRTVGKC